MYAQGGKISVASSKSVKVSNAYNIKMSLDLCVQANKHKQPAGTTTESSCPSAVHKTTVVFGSEAKNVFCFQTVIKVFLR